MIDFNEKTVALVGPSPEVRGMADKIEAHDIVVRMNRSMPVSPYSTADVGRRTDVWITCFAENLIVDSEDFVTGFRNRLDICGEHVPRMIVTWPLGVEARVTAQWPEFRRATLPYGIPTIPMPRKTYEKVQQDSGTNPSTGLLAIEWLLSKPIARLDIYGMTFFATGYRAGCIETGSDNIHDPRPPVRPPLAHEPSKEREWFLKVMERDGRVRPDEAMAFLAERGLAEEEKYRHLHTNLGGYGDSNRGVEFLPTMLARGMRSVVDIGCGHNDFVRGLPDGIRGVGVDVACEAADRVCDAAATPFNDKEFDYVSAFDFLEHVAPAKVDDVIAEMKRISDRFMLLVSFKPDTHFKVAGMSLHPSAENFEWWRERLGSEAKPGMDAAEYEDWGVFHGEWS